MIAEMLDAEKSPASKLPAWRTPTSMRFVLTVLAWNELVNKTPVLIVGAKIDPVGSRIQICPDDASVDNGIVFGWKKFPVIVPLILANGILER
jgi:hypothetical protein